MRAHQGCGQFSEIGTRSAKEAWMPLTPLQVGLSAVQRRHQATGARPRKEQMASSHHRKRHQKQAEVAGWAPLSQYSLTVATTSGTVSTTAIRQVWSQSLERMKAEWVCLDTFSSLECVKTLAVKQGPPGDWVIRPTSKQEHKSSELVGNLEYEWSIGTFPLQELRGEVFRGRSGWWV